ncbi:OmpH family outer membrane protein [bacterium]|nr:OmpH family outer membrane protein [bacterium]
MKKLILFIIITIASTGWIYAQPMQGPVLPSSDLKIGMVNSEMVLQSYPEFSRAEKQLEREAQTWRSDRAGWEADMERIGVEITELEGRLIAGQNTFTPKKKSDMQRQIDSLKIDYQERINQQMAMEQERLQTRRAELLTGVLEIVNESIEEIGKENNFDFILDASNGTVVYAKNPEDITDLLLRHLQDK